MTTKDEKMFCKTLRACNPNIYFLDVKPSFEACVNGRLVSDVTELNSEFFSIVNLDLLSKEELSVIRYVTDIITFSNWDGLKCNFYVLHLIQM